MCRIVHGCRLRDANIDLVWCKSRSDHSSNWLQRQEGANDISQLWLCIRHSLENLEIKSEAHEKILIFSYFGWPLRLTRRIRSIQAVLQKFWGVRWVVLFCSWCLLSSSQNKLLLHPSGLGSSDDGSDGSEQNRLAHLGRPCSTNFGVELVEKILSWSRLTNLKKP